MKQSKVEIDTIGIVLFQYEWIVTEAKYRKKIPYALL